MNDYKIADLILQFNSRLTEINLQLPENFIMINPFNGDNKKQIEEITTLFYQKFYSDNKKRYMILGSSPARRGTAVTGVPFEDAEHLFQITKINVENFHINKSSSNFLYDVIEKYGGCKKFYQDFYMNFVCPIGIARINSKGNIVNCNYYESEKLKTILKPLIIQSIKEQLKFNINRSVCFCIGSGENYNFLMKLNQEYNFFDNIVPLEHPRFIMQYNSTDKDKYLQKYLNTLKLKKNQEM